MKKLIHVIGYGSQGSAWAKCLRDSGWDVRVYLLRSDSESARRAKGDAFNVLPVFVLPAVLAHLKLENDESHLVAMLCPDLAIAPLYQEVLSPLQLPITLILAHGFAVYAKQLRLSQTQHELALLAPKAIGPKLRAEFVRAQTHELVAAFYSEPLRQKQVEAVAGGLGFHTKNLVHASFDQEAIGDLISEQILLCGGVFTLLEQARLNMKRVGVPERLIKEECLTELALIADLIKTKGVVGTMNSISEAAQAGASLFYSRALKQGVSELCANVTDAILSRDFVREYETGQWQATWERLKTELSQLESEASV